MRCSEVVTSLPSLFEMAQMYRQKLLEERKYLENNLKSSMVSVFDPLDLPKIQGSPLEHRNNQLMNAIDEFTNSSLSELSVLGPKIQAQITAEKHVFLLLLWNSLGKAITLVKSHGNIEESVKLLEQCQVSPIFFVNLYCYVSIYFRIIQLFCALLSVTASLTMFLVSSKMS